MGRLMFFIAEALRAMRRNAAPSMAAIVTIGVTTLLLGVLIPVLRASAAKTEDVRSQIHVRVYLYHDATQRQTAKLKHDLNGLDHVTGTQYVSKREAVHQLRARYPQNGGIVNEGLGALKNNPLPASFNVEIDNPDNLRQVHSEIAPPDRSGNPKPISPIISDVNDSTQFATPITEVTKAVKIILGVIAGLLLVASLLLVANTIRLSIYARRREVEVMRLVGATSWFIRWPFMFEGILVGFAGAAIAVGILWLGKVTIVDPLSNDFNLIANLETMSFVPLVAILVAAAMAVSALGSGITLRRFLRI